VRNATVFAGRLIMECIVRSNIMSSRKAWVMKITEIKVFPVNEERLKAYVSITIENSFVVRDLKVIQGTTGLFVAMPSKKRKDGQFRDVAHPLNQDTRALIEDMVFAAYETELKSLGQTLVDLRRQKVTESTEEYKPR
jgi:stage V sporulation protein G